MQDEVTDGARLDDVRAFWQWFQQGPAHWPPAGNFSAAQLNELYDAIEKRFPELTAVMSCLPHEYFEIQFSAKLQPEAAPLIRALSKDAPELPNWRFVSFQPALGFYDMNVSWLGLPFSQIPSARMNVDVLETKPARLRVYVPDYDAKLAFEFDQAVRLLLEAGMGEQWLLEELDELELVALAEAPPTAAQLVDLPELLQAI
jgi:hypothetical protein